MVDSAGVEMRRVLDLYAGTGAIGIEALSRGAGWVDFVERDRGLARTIGDNLKATGSKRPRSGACAGCGEGSGSAFG